MTGGESALEIDSRGDGGGVLFAHARHQERLGGAAGSCARCHHRNRRGDRGTSCAACHRDLYATTDTFDHARHAAATGGNDGCIRCHTADGTAKTRAASTPCDTCHRREVSTAARLARTSTPPAGVAAGYRDAMHGLCIECHRGEDARHGETAHRSRCAFCHGGRRAVLDAPAAPAVPAVVASAGERS